MKHTKKWLQITAGTLALTGAIATPIALTSCSKTNSNPFQPIETNGQIEVAWKEGASEKLTLEPFSVLNINIDDLFSFKNKETGQEYQASELQIEHYRELLNNSLFEYNTLNLLVYQSDNKLEGVDVLPPGEFQLEVNRISLKSDNSINSYFGDSSLLIPINVKDLPEGKNELLPNGYNDFEYKLSLSLSSQIGNFTFEKNINAEGNTLNLNENDLSKLNNDVDINDNSWLKFVDCSAITCSLASKSNSYIRINEQNNSILKTPIYIFPLKSSLVNFHNAILDDSTPVDTYSNISEISESVEILKFANNISYNQYYKNKSLELYLYLADSTNLVTSDPNQKPSSNPGEIFQKFTVNFN